MPLVLGPFAACNYVFTVPICMAYVAYPWCILLICITCSSCWEEACGRQENSRRAQFGQQLWGSEYVGNICLEIFVFEEVGTTARTRMFCWKYLCFPKQRIFSREYSLFGNIFIDTNCKCRGRLFCLRILLFANSYESQSELAMKPCQNEWPADTIGHP